MPDFLTTSDGEKIAYEKSDGNGPTLIWCGGLKSDMEGSKATHLHNWAKTRGQAFIRFDYFGHGQSSGEFTDGFATALSFTLAPQWAVGRHCWRQSPIRRAAQAWFLLIQPRILRKN